VPHARLPSERVVDVLKRSISANDGQHFSLACAEPPLCEPIDKQRAVGQTGQLVVGGEVVTCLVGG
jgi:hypothetical protein